MPFQPRKMPSWIAICGKISIMVILSLLIISCSENEYTEILVAGGGTSGVAAGIRAARMGVSTVIIGEHEWLGGMLTSAGVSATDGNYNLPGVSGENSGRPLRPGTRGDSLLRTGWVSNILFEPSAGNQIFTAMAEAEPGLEVVGNATVTRVKRIRNKWRITVSRGDRQVRYYAKILIDATELGDIAAMCGVEYDLGMDSRHDTGEEIAPEREMISSRI
ncbi:MAG: FAD-dependent oxidoreductase [Bacteroidales bacterium]